MSGALSANRSEQASSFPLGFRMVRLGQLPLRAFDSARRTWRRSLQLRIVTITVLLSTLAVAGTGTYMAYSIGKGLFDARLAQLQSESDSATSAAQRTFDSSTATDQTSLESLLFSAIDSIRITAASLSGLGFYRAPANNSPLLLQDRTSGDGTSAISLELRQAVASGAGTQQWQSVSLTRPDGIHPGVIIGSTLEISTAGQYQLYFVYDLTDVASTLGFVQNTLWIGGLALVVLIGAVTWLVVMLVIAPIRVAAETSQKLAAGQLEERIPERGEDVLATLARSFNGMADSLQRQITQLANLSKVQQRFVSDVSHELRTPLTTIRLAGDVLYDQRASFPPTTERTTELLHTQVERFDSLLADLLEISRFDARAEELQIEPVNLVRLAEDAIGTIEALADRKGSELTLVTPGGHFEADMDPRRIRRVVRNLLANAIEHGEGRPVRIIVDSNATAVALCVRDYGIGMSRSDLDRVFDRFWRADPSRQRSTGGTGLGLAISLEDATLHGGWLHVWSEPGRGSCFRLTLPRTAGVPIATSPLPLPPDDVEGSL